MVLRAVFAVHGLGVWADTYEFACGHRNLVEPDDMVDTCKHTGFRMPADHLQMRVAAPGMVDEP